MLGAKISVIVILCLIIIAGFAWLVKIILGRHKKLDKIILAKAMVQKDTDMSLIADDKMTGRHPVKCSVAVNGEVNKFYEANIVMVNKTDGVGYEPVDPNKMPVNSLKWLNRLDIVIERTPINKALNEEFPEK
ncbi:MAG: hypothetical protein K6T80_04650 [Firmicutes bacterium]|nr:hypothetical protein [Bacillota bacterium]